MKVKAKNLLFSSLPSAKRQKKLMKAQSGKRLGETGMSPLDLQTLPNNYFNELNKIIKPDTPLEPGSMNAFDNIQGMQGFTPTGPNRVDPITWDPLSGNTPRRPTTPQAQAQQRPPLRKDMFNPGEAAVLGLSAFDALLPDWYPKQQVVQPQMGYNPNLYGTGSQAIAQAGARVQTTKSRDINPTKVADVPSRQNYDARLKAYEDSLYNWNITKERAEGITPEGVVQMSNATFDELPFRSLDYDFQPQGYRYTSEGRKMALYERPIDPGYSANVQATGLRPADLSQKPTKYSATVRDPSDPSGQRNIYFKDKKTWRNFVDSGAISTISTGETDDSATAAGYRTMQQGGSVPIYVPKDTVKSIHLEDKRKVNPATGKPFKTKNAKTIDAPQSNIHAIIAHAKAQGVDPYDALAVAMQESQIGTVSPNFGQVLGENYWNQNREALKKMDKRNASAHVLSAALKDKSEYAKTLAKKGVIPATDAHRLQTYNGLGKLTPTTEQRIYGHTNKAFYEIPVTAEQPLDLKKNPAYGKTVMSLRDEILRNNQDIRNMVDTTQAFKMEQGGWIQKAINPKHKGYCTPMTKSTCTPKRKALAKTLKKLAKKRKHENGGIIPDNMSPFYPAQYQQGGPVSPQAGLTYGPDYNFGFLNRTPTSSDSIMYRNAYNRALLDPQRFQQMDVTPAFGRTYGAQDTREARTWMDIALTNANVLQNAQRDISQFGPNANAAPVILHRPKDTVKKKGKKGAHVNKTGYKDGGPTAGNPFNIIPGGDITMQGVSQPINAIPLRDGIPMAGPMTMMPGQDYSFDADSVFEYPMRAGGQLSAAKAKEMLRDGKANGKKLTAKQKRYFGMVAAGKAQAGMAVSTTEPAPPQLSAQERYYQASARLGHYKGILNEKLKAKNPQGFQDYFGALTPLRRSGRTAEAQKYVQEAPYEDYLSPEEVQSTLSPEDYNDYLTSLQDVNAYNVQQGQQPLFGTKEGENDIRKLNYGRRFASLQLTPSVGVSNTEGTKKYNRQYNYDPRTRQVSFTESGDQGLRPSYLNPATPPVASTASLRKGGVIYDDGGQIGTMWGGSSELASYNPYDGGTVEFQGASHDNGGIGMHYNGQPVEVEGGEYAAQDSAGNLNIFGNMYLPGTRTKFKKVAQEIAKKEKNYDMLKTKGSQYVQESNPANKFEKLKFNSGRVMMEGGELGQRDLAQKKEQLSGLQKAMLDTAAEFGLDAEKMSAGRIAKARKGKQVKKKGYYQAGGPVNDPTMADRNNNPGNIKWSKFARQMGAKKGPPAADGGNFAVFPSREKGVQAMEKLLTSKSYKDLDVESAITKWTGGHPYNYDLSSMRGKKVSELTPQERQQMMNTMMVGEGTRYGPGAKPPAAPPAIPGAPAPPFTPYGLPPVPGFTPDPQRPRPGTVQPPFDPLNPPPDPGPIPSDVEPLHFGQIMGEIFGAATNSVEPVPAQRYEPQLYQPFQVSFQDRLNLNQNSFNALRRGVGAGNPSALGELAAQKYAADTMVKGEEFRTNQAIANDVTNKNVSLLNDAELKNLGIADTQMVRQSTARSKTRAMDQMIVNSLASKIEQNKFENKRLAAYENLYDYRFVPQDDGGLRATYYGPNAMFNFSGNNDRGQNPDVKTISRYDQHGNLKGYHEFDDYDLREQQRALDLEMKRRNLPLLQVPPLNKRGG